MRSALLGVAGVSRARVSLEDHEAIVDYDPKKTTVKELIAAVDRARGPADSITYRASEKPAPK